MKPELKGISSNDLSDSVSLPPDPANCRICITAAIGIADTPGADNFDFYFCTTAFVEEKIDEHGFFCDRGTVIVKRFSWEVAEIAISTICEQANGDSWDELAKSISKVGMWEFEGYTDH